MRRIFILLALVAGLSACVEPTGVASGPIAGPGSDKTSGSFRVSAGDRSKIQTRVLDAINALRAEKGRKPLAYNARLNAAALTHSRDMMVQNRAWHFGSDGSSPIDRVQRARYQGRLRGEDIAETYESDMEILAAWMKERPTREVILDRYAEEIGFAWRQEMSGKIWWTLVTGKPTTPAPRPDS